MDRERVRETQDDIWNEIERLVRAAQAKGTRLDDGKIADEIVARFPDSGLTANLVRRELSRFGDVVEDRAASVLAKLKGFTLSPRKRPGYYGLMHDGTQSPQVNPATRGNSFSFGELLAFLKDLPDAPRKAPPT